MALDIRTIAVDYDLFVNILQGKVFRDLVNVADDKSEAYLLNKVIIAPESLPLIPNTNFNRAVYIVEKEDGEKVYYPLVTFVLVN